MKQIFMLPFLAVIFGLTIVNAQTQIIGKIVNLKEGSIIPFATVKYKNEFTSADDNGIFVINTKFKLNNLDSILVSCIGYSDTKVNILQQISNDTLLVKLNIGINLLNEVVVVGNNRVEKDINKIFKTFANKFLSKINDKPFDSKLLYREFSEQNNTYVDFVEAVGLKHFEGFNDKKLMLEVKYTALHKFENIRGVNSRVINTATTGYHPLIWQMAADYVETILYNYLLGNFVDDLKLNLLEINSTGGNNTYAISFEPKKKNWGYPTNIYDFIKGSSGVIYLNTRDYSIEKVKFNNSNLDKGIKIKNTKYKNELTGLNGNINYVNINGRSTPSYIEFNYLFKDLKSNNLITKKMQYYFSDFKFDGQSTAELATRYGVSITKAYPFRGMSVPENIKFYKNPVYNPVFWKNELGYPEFWDLAKVTRDFKKQNLVLEDEFKKFDNKLNP